MTSTTHFDPEQVFTPLLKVSFSQFIQPHVNFSAFETVKTISPVRDVTSMINLTGPVSVMLLLVLDHSLAWQVMQSEVLALGLEENEEMLDAVLGEITNIIGGNATASLTFNGQAVHLSLPMIIRAASLRPGVSQVSIQKSSLSHPGGILDVYCVMPAIPGIIGSDESTGT
ncbi:MAG: chemotaxis protein CheX [Gammaproteobacteria bacterium]|nr:chemotaxis protein CheX [Gammaproteobacteria bacterium]